MTEDTSEPRGLAMTPKSADQIRLFEAIIAIIFVAAAMGVAPSFWAALWSGS